MSRFTSTATGLHNVGRSPDTLQLAENVRRVRMPGATDTVELATIVARAFGPMAQSFGPLAQIMRPLAEPLPASEWSDQFQKPLGHAEMAGRSAAAAR